MRAEHTEIDREGQKFLLHNPSQKAKIDSKANRHGMTYTNKTVCSKSKYFPGICLGNKSWVIFSAFMTQIDSDF